MTSLVTWLDMHPGVVLTHPPTVEAAHVILALLAQPGMAGRNALIMTSDPGVYGDTLPPELFIPYTASPLLTTALASEALIFIDSLLSFRRFGTANLFRTPFTAKPILLATWGVKMEDLTEIFHLYPWLKPLVVRFLDDGVQLEFTLALTRMTPEQEGEYRRRLALEQQLAQTGDRDEVYGAIRRLRTLQVGNFLYPPERQYVLNFPRKVRPPLIPDMAWFHPAIAQHLNAYSPKFHRLLNHLLAQSGQRHVVYTRFKEHFGLNLLWALFRYVDLEPVVVTGDDNGAERQAKYQRFNSHGASLLLTTVLPTEQLLDVHHLHFVEGYDRATLHAFLKVIYRRSSYPPGARLEVTSHVAQCADGTNASDAEYYEVIAAHIKELNTAYTELLNWGASLIFGAQGLRVIAAPSG